MFPLRTRSEVQSGRERGYNSKGGSTGSEVAKKPLQSPGGAHSQVGEDPGQRGAPWELLGKAGAQSKWKKKAFTNSKSSSAITASGSGAMVSEGTKLQVALV